MGKWTGSELEFGKRHVQRIEDVGKCWVQSRPRTETANLERLGATLDGKEQNHEITWGFSKIIQVPRLHGQQADRGMER